MLNEVVNTNNMKTINKFTVLNHIRNNNYSRADIARVTSLTRASITNIVNELISENIVVEGEFAEIKIGRRAIKLSINTEFAYSIGISITRYSFFINVIDMNCNILEEYSLETYNEQTKNDVMDFICKKISYFLSKYKNKIIGIGINSPGPVDSEKGIILNPPNFSEWQYFNICQYLYDKFNIPCYLEKEANSYILFENTFGVGKKENNFLYVFADEGLGSSLIINKKLSEYGKNIELGHISIDSINGKHCSCGNLGCLELYASIPNFLQEAKNNGYNFNSWEEIVDSAYDNNENALNLIDKMSAYLSSAFVTFLSLYNIDTIVLAFSLTYRSELLIEKTTQLIRERTIYKQNNNVKICISELQYTNSKAAGNIVFEKFFENKLL